MSFYYILIILIIISYFRLYIFVTFSYSLALGSDIYIYFTPDLQWCLT